MLVSILSGSYVTISGIHSYLKYKHLYDDLSFNNINKGKYDLRLKIYSKENKNNFEGVVLNNIKENIEMPTYVNIGSNVGASIPIGGGDIKVTEEFLTSKFNMIKNQGNTIEFSNFQCVEKYDNKFYINTNNKLESILNHYKIDSKNSTYKYEYDYIYR
jgi:hypothetical protein